MNKLLVICGPTATGKTRIAADLARKFDGELVSADSRQVYKDMDIGTGKDKSELGKVPLWMIDVVNPNEEFSVSHYVRLAKSAIADIRKRGKNPIVIGGTGFYINALIRPFDTLDVPPNFALREKLSNIGVEVLQTQLRLLDKTVFEKMNDSDKMNPRRLIRKIEIVSGSSARGPLAEEKNVLIIALTAPYKKLYRRIDTRVDMRVSQGITREIDGLLDRGYSWDLPAMNTLGYKQWRDVFTQNAPIDDAIQKWKYDEHAYARRQMTWFRNMPDIEWFDVTDPEVSAQVTRKVWAWYTQKEVS